MCKIKNEEQFKQYFYLYLLEDLFCEDFNIDYLEHCLCDYLMYYGYKGCHDILEVLDLYYEKGVI